LHAPLTSEVYLGGFIMGHELVGRIAGVGRDVTGWRIGQRVCINPNGDTDGICEECRSGRLNHCVAATRERAVGLQADGAPTKPSRWPAQRPLARQHLSLEQLTIAVLLRVATTTNNQE
jgi:D-arabinose 1-dehydrogenase-like Zn-dependent alcohol dehydrogenase